MMSYKISKHLKNLVSSVGDADDSDPQAMAPETSENETSEMVSRRCIPTSGAERDFHDGCWLLAVGCSFANLVS